MKISTKKKPSPLKVLILSRDFSSSNIGGVVGFISILTKKLSHNVVPINFSIGRKDQRGSLISNAVVVIRTLFLLTRMRIGSKFDVVHINPSLQKRALLRDGVYLLLLKLLRFDSVLVYFHGWNLEVEHRIEHSFFLKMMFRFIYGQASVIVVLASSFKQRLISWGFDECKVKVMTTMFDGETVGVLKNQPLKGRPVNILFLSRLVKEKGVFELLEAFSLLINEGYNFKLIVAGDGAAFIDLQAKVYELELGGSVEFCGHVSEDEKTRTFKRGDIFILPSYGEGCPVSLLEAMAFGMPVIATKVGGIPDFVKDWVNGRLIDSLSPADIKQAVLDMAVPERHLAISSFNSRQAWDTYEASAITADIEALYFKAYGE